MTSSKSGRTAIRALEPNSSRQTVCAAAAVRANSSANQPKNSQPAALGKGPRPLNSPARAAQNPNSQAASESAAAPASPSRAALLPFWVWAVQAGYAFVLALVLGRPQADGYTGLELLRAWAMGYFSRLDAFLLLVWLAAALWRLCLLAFVLRRLARLNGGQKAPAQQPEKGAQR